ncbi:peptidoglycan-binding domain-containing protein [Streptomyces collinus]|uniref:peptidoglycan-binding domain-containing protein n=1 Tax=Streptomyces collinus TaxID=42684 RepID=UPI00339DD639
MKHRTKAVLRGATVALSAAVLIGVGTSSASARVGAPTIRYGNSGFNVQCVQYALNHWNSVQGRSNHLISVDGIFGDNTLAEVRRYQQAYGLDADGVVGPVTGGRMYWAWIDGDLDGPACYQAMPTQS